MRPDLGRLAGLMNGSVGFSSEAGQGSRFWVEVPTIARRSPTRARGTAPSAPPPLAAGGVRYTVVYFEDNPCGGR